MSSAKPFGQFPRSPKTFGVAGLLTEKARVYYDNVFSLKHVGRISDLISARLQKAGPNELKLRALLLYGVFEAYTAQAMATTTHPGQVSLECGIDEEKIAIGVAFNIPEGHGFDEAGVVQRVNAKAPNGSFEQLLVYLLEHANQVVVRYQKSQRRVEVVSLVGLPGKIAAESLDEPAALQLILLEEISSDAIKIEAYIQLADLDYGALLQEDSPGALVKTPFSGEILVKATASLPESAETVKGAKGAAETSEKVKGTGEDELSRIVKGSKDGAEGASLVKGATDARDGSTLVNGAPQQQDTLITRLSGDKNGDESFGGSSGTAKTAADLATAELKVKLYQDKIRELQNRIATMEQDRANFQQTISERPAASSDVPAGTAQSEPPAQKTKKKGFFGGMFASKNEKDAEGNEKVIDPKIEIIDVELDASVLAERSPQPYRRLKIDAGSMAEEEIAQVTLAPGETVPRPVATRTALAADVPVSDMEAGAGPEVTPTSVADLLVKIKRQPDAASNQMATIAGEMTTGLLTRTVDRAQAEIEDIKNEISSERAKRWIDGLLQDIVQEKSQLNEMAKSLNAASRAKENEFNLKERLLTEELRLRDDLIRQKNYTVTKNKEQLTQLHATIEKLRVSGGNDDDPHSKQKFAQVQKLLTVSKEENLKLVGSVQELKNQLINAQSKRQPADPAVQIKLDRSLKQVDEFKKVNQQLLERLNEMKSKSSETALAETKRKLETQLKMVVASKKESERLTAKVEEMQKEELRLKTELGKTSAENRRLKSTKARADKEAAEASGGVAAATAALAGTKQGGGKSNPPKAA